MLLSYRWVKEHKIEVFLNREFLQGKEVRTGILKQLRYSSLISKQSHYGSAFFMCRNINLPVKKTNAVCIVRQLDQLFNLGH